MSTSNYYASIAIVEVTSELKVHIETVSISQAECVLSGAWNLNMTDGEKIKNILSDKMIIGLGDINLVTQLFDQSEIHFLSMDSFLSDAKSAVRQGMISYETFKAEDPVKRKNLVAPDFYEWPDTIDFNSSSEYLKSIGKIITPPGTPDEFKRILAAARLLKFLIDMWHSDEQERIVRKYIEADDSKINILPESWLSQGS